MLGSAALEEFFSDGKNTRKKIKITEKKSATIIKVKTVNKTFIPLVLVGC